MKQLNFFEEDKHTEYKSRHVAKILSSGKLIYSGPKNDLTNECMCWYSADDSNERDCAVVMDNKQFLRMRNNGEIVLIKTDKQKGSI